MTNTSKAPRLSALIPQAKLLSAHARERTYLYTHAPSQQPYVLKLTAAPARWREAKDPVEAALWANLPQLPEIMPWLGLERLEPAQAQALGLEAEAWLLSARAWAQGQPLTQLEDLEQRWLSLSLNLALSLRDLHEAQLIHGDLQPGNVLAHPDDQITLIDLPLLATTPEDRGHIAGSAPFMAPELWRGLAPDQSADLYALGCLICWLAGEKRYSLSAQTLSQWAQAHGQGSHQLPDALTGRLRGVVQRVLQPQASRRATLQELIDELSAGQSTPSVRPIQIGGQPHASLTRALLTQLHEAATHQGVVRVELQGQRGAGKTTLLRTLARRLELLGVRCVLASAQGAQPSPLNHEALSGPWAPLLEVLSRLGGSSQALELGVGDQLHTFSQLNAAFAQAAAQGPAAILWDDLDRTSPDIQAWWAQLGLERWPSTLSFIASATTTTSQPSTWLEPCPLPQPSAKDWDQWRAQTSRTEVRDLPQGQWEQLLRAHGDTIGQLLAALNKSLGVTSPAQERKAQPQRDTPHDIKDEIAQVRALIQFRAHREAAARAQAYMAEQQPHLEAQDSAGTLELLQLWMSASLSAGLSAHQSEQLKAALLKLCQRQGFEVTGRLCLAELLHGLGQYQEGLERLAELDLEPKADASAYAQVARWSAQLQLSSGQLKAASQRATQGLLALGVAGPLNKLRALDEELAHLLLLKHAADAISGDREAIDALKTISTQLTGPQFQGILRARCHAYIALGLTRNDEREAATDAYLRALEEIEAAGLMLELPTYLLNVGTSYHRQGRLGLAREYYARGTRVATAQTRPSTRAWLLANQANIDMTIGRLDEAKALMSSASALAQQHRVPAIEATALAFEGYIASMRGLSDEALGAYERCLSSDLSKLTQLKAEVLLHQAEVFLHKRERALAQRALNEARQLIDEHDLNALRDLHGVLRARKMWVDGDPMGVMGGVELFRRRLISARDAGNYRLILQQSPYLLSKLAQEAMFEVHAELVELVESARNAVAMGLTRELREDFFANLPSPANISAPVSATPLVQEHTPKPQPITQALPASPARHAAISSPAVAAPPDETIERFYRMLSLNEIILRTDKLEALWPKALEIALSLSGAERGFLLLRRGQAQTLKIVASRDIDGEQIPQPHLKVSQTIAEEAARTGRTVITINAREDERFNVALSVVDLDLTSVLCVPVRDASGLLGALYLDHRFEPGIFYGQAARMMEAYAHQLALAITNVERVEALRAEREALAQARAELEALLKEREARLEGLELRIATLSDEVERAKEESGLRELFPEIAYSSRQMGQVLEQVRRIARGDVPVVIIGESGTGKELIARAVHQASPRAGGPFIPFNCGAVTESLFESEMFGHVKGAFTGATMDRKGLFQAAQGGTIFLDELGELPLSMQVKLLRVLQERKVRRVGATQHEPIDVRIVAATNRDLMEMVQEGKFREDLYYRLAAFVLMLPALRERVEDIPLIAHAVLKRVGQETVKRELRLSPEAAQALLEQPWPGNIRELENALRAACVLCETDEITLRELLPMLSMKRLPPKTQDAPSPPQRVASTTATAAPTPGLKKPTRGRRPKASKAKVEAALRQADNDPKAAASLLDVSERTLYRYMSRFNLYDP